MKVHIEIDCSPEEARTFMGLPDVGKANDVYVDMMSKAMEKYCWRHDTVSMSKRGTFWDDSLSSKLRLSSSTPTRSILFPSGTPHLRAWQRTRSSMV